MQAFWKKYYKQILLTCLMGIVIYLPSFHAPFQFDDYRIIVNNILVKNVKEVIRIWRWDPSRFLSHMTFAMNYSFTQKEVFGYHFVNFIIHLLTTVSVFHFITILLKKFKSIKEEAIARVAFFSCLIFLVHPIQTSAVTYIVQRSALLATLFYVMAMIGYIRYQETQSKGYLIGSLASAFLGCFCKPIIITLPFALAMYEHVSTYPKKENFLKTLKKIGPYFFMVLLVPLLLIMWRYKSADLSKYGDITRETTYLTRPEYLLTQINVVRTYLRLLIIPIGQNLDYDYPITRFFFNAPTVLSFSLLCAFLLGGIKLLKKHKVLSFAIFWFFITLSLESSIFPIADVIFEHRLYLPLSAFVLIVPLILSQIFTNKRIYKMIMILLIICLGVLTFKRNLVWHDGVGFMEDIAEKSNNKSRVQNSLGYAYYKAGQFKKAEEAFKKSLEITPAGVISSRAQNNLGIIYFDQGEYDKAIYEFQRALKLSESEHTAAIALNHIGRVYLAKNQFDQAINYYNQAIRLSPLMFEAINNRGAIYRQQGKMELALKDYNRALQINPMDEDIYSNKGLFYRILGNFDLSIAAYTKAINVNSQDAQLYYDRGIVYKEMRQYKNAVKDFNQALQIQEDYKEVYNERGIVLSKARKYSLALKDYNRALALDSAFFDAYYNRGLLYWKTGEYQKAINDGSQALLIDNSFADAYYLKAMAHSSLHQYPQAIEDLDKVLLLDPDHHSALTQRQEIKKRITHPENQ